MPLELTKLTTQPLLAIRRSAFGFVKLLLSYKILRSFATEVAWSFGHPWMSIWSFIIFLVILQHRLLHPLKTSETYYNTTSPCWWRPNVFSNYCWRPLTPATGDPDLLPPKILISSSAPAAVAVELDLHSYWRPWGAVLWNLYIQTL